MQFYDADARLTNRSHRDGSGTTFLATGLSYDAKGQVTGEVEGNLGRNYTYDQVG